MPHQIKCPTCLVTLREVERDGVHVDSCRCGGLWFDRGELESWMANHGRVASPPAQQELVVRAGNEICCPRCESLGLQRFEMGQVRGALCQQCHGVWLTALDVRQASRLPGAPPAETEGLAGSIGYALCDGTLQFLAELLGGL